MKKIKAIIFDIDGVLVDSVKANAIFFERIFKAIGGTKYTQIKYIKRNHLTMWNIIKYFTKEKSKARVDKLLKFAKKFPYPFEYVSVPKNGAKVLRILSTRYKLAVVTARVKVGVRPVLKRYGYDKYIGTAVAFEDYKKPKPYPEPLLVALRKLRIKPSEAVYIGDMEADVLCAKAAGVVSVLYKNSYSNVKKAKPDYTVKSFGQLLRLFNYAGQN